MNRKVNDNPQRSICGQICVAEFSFSKSFCSYKAGKMSFALPIFFTILIAIVFSQLVLVSQPYNKDSLFSLFNFEVFSPVNLFIMAVSTVVILYLFLRAVKTGKEIAVRVLASFYILAGCYSILLVSRLVFIMTGSDSQLLLLVPAAATFVGMFGAFLVFIGNLPVRERNRLFVISSGAFGALVGVIMPTSLVLGVLIAFSIADTILVLNKSIQKSFGELKYEEILQQLTFSTTEWGIGIGDLICYSIITANTSIYFGIYPGILSLVLVLIGSYITMRVAAKQSRFPGLPIPTALSLLPSLGLLLFS